MVYPQCVYVEPEDLYAESFSPQIRCEHPGEPSLMGYCEDHAGNWLHDLRDLRRKVASLEATNAKLVAALEALRVRHTECEDTWYACPLSSEGCSNDAIDPNKCDCGADEKNAVIDAALVAAKGEVQP